jgi:hypothetical protein
MSLSKSSSGSKVGTGASVALTLYLKHFRNSTIDYVLEKTGYSCITEYEDLCYYTDVFPIEISVNGAIHTSVPSVDPALYRVFKLSVHHLNERVRKHIMTNYVGMSTLDYELLHADKNTIVIWVPYKNESIRRSSSFGPEVAGWAPGAEDETEEDLSDTEVWVPSTPPTHAKAKPQPEKKSRRTQIVEDDDDKPIVPLYGWKFKMNAATNNSYILTPPTSVQWVKSGTVGWGDSKTTPTSWHAPIEGLTRPLYYNNATGGWIVSLRMREQLTQAGARELK